MITAAIVSKVLVSILSSVGGNVISDKINDYMKKRKPEFEKELKLADSHEKTILLLAEVIRLKDMQIELAKGIIEKDLPKEEEEKNLEMLATQTEFVKNLQDIANISIKEIEDKLRKKVIENESENKEIK